MFVNISRPFRLVGIFVVVFTLSCSGLCIQIREHRELFIVWCIRNFIVHWTLLPCLSRFEPCWHFKWCWPLWIPALILRYVFRNCVYTSRRYTYKLLWGNAEKYLHEAKPMVASPLYESWCTCSIHTRTTMECIAYKLKLRKRASIDLIQRFVHIDHFTRRQ